MFFRHYAVPAIAGLTLAPAASGCSQPLHIERDDAIALPAPSATPPQPRDDDAGTTDAGPSDASAGVTPGAHAVFLPYLRLQGLAPPIGSVAPGEFPSPEFPAGTVYVARSESDGAYLTEWDLASATIRKRRRLDVPAHDRFVRLRRIGDALHVVVWAYRGDTRYVRLTLDLESEQSAFLGMSMSKPEWSIAGDSSLTVLAGKVSAEKALYPKDPTDEDIRDAISTDQTRILPVDRGWFTAFAFDQAGRLTAQRHLVGWPEDPTHASSVVIDHDVFFLAYFELDPKLLRYNRALRQQRIYDVPTADPGEVRLPLDALVLGSDGRVVVESHDPRTAVVFTPRESAFGPLQPCESAPPMPDSDQDVWLGSEHVTLRQEEDDDWVEWTDRVPAVPPSPCDLAR